MHLSLTSTLTLLLDVLLPPRGTEKAVRNLTPNSLTLLSHQGSLPYHHPSVTALIWEIKYRKNQRAIELAGTFLKDEVMGIASESLGSPLLLPIPMHDARRKERGFNQTELLCEAILREIPQVCLYEPEILTKVRNTRSQQGLPKYRRVRNMIGAMEVTSSDKIKDAVCIVVDDVSTTGATFAEATRVLRLAGVKEVHCISLAHS